MSDRQLRACGLSRSAVWRWAQAGRLHRLYPGVYAVGHLALTVEGRLIAALFHAGGGAALSAASGAHWWRLIDAAPDAIQISVPTRKRPVAGIVWHHPTEVARVLHRRLPVTPVPRTLLDFAADASEREVRSAVANADYLGLLDLAATRAMTGQGRPGSATLRAVLDTYMPELAHTLSPLEDEFMLLCKRERLPLPQPNRWVGGYLVDALWPEQRVIAELDGRAAHSSDAQRLRDRERDMRLRALGYTVLRYTWHQVVNTPAAVTADLRQALMSTPKGGSVASSR